MKDYIYFNKFVGEILDTDKSPIELDASNTNEASEEIKNRNLGLGELYKKVQFFKAPNESGLKTK